MVSLTSCYFCGDAVDASVQEHDLPASAQSDDQVTLALCGDCRAKLDLLLDRLGSAEPAPDDADTVDDTAGESGGATDTPDETSVQSSNESSAASDDTDDVAEMDPSPAADDAAADSEDSIERMAARVEGVSRELGASEDAEDTGETVDADDAAGAGGAADADEAADVTESAVDPDPVAGDPEPVFGGNGPADAEERDATAVERSSTAAAAPARAESDTGTADDAGGEDPIPAPAAGSSTTNEQPGKTDREKQPTDADETASDGGTSETQDPLDAVSTRTYNRVVRLLQNREFPVDRADFEALATSAYELQQEECGAALDAAIEKGLLEEADGELHRPE